MTYNFDKVINRRNTYSLKWNVEEQELPMWVADMDFETAPAIKEALAERVSHGVFGYVDIPDEWYKAYMGWWDERHHLQIEKEWLVFCTGVVPALSSIVRKLTTPGEKVLVQTPVYNMFFNSVVNNGREVLESPLVYDGSEYHIDFADLEEKLADPQTTMMILCNPHNPVGKIWDKETLARIGELCFKHHVVVVSDDIHCDLTAPDSEYIPFASVSEACRDNSITCMAPTKTFNIAGLKTAAVMIPNPVLRHKVWRGLNTDEVAEPNAFAVNAAIAAFTKGGAWLDELRVYVQENREIAAQYMAEHIPQIKIVPAKATYLLWLDCTKMQGNTTEITKFIRKETGLYVTAGGVYGGSGDRFIRMNIACPKATLMDGLDRLKKGVEAYEKQFS